MYRLLILFLLGVCWMGSAVQAADYEINLSVLNALGKEEVDEELPIPQVFDNKVEKKNFSKIVPDKIKKVKVKSEKTKKKKKIFVKEPKKEVVLKREEDDVTEKTKIPPASEIAKTPEVTMPVVTEDKISVVEKKETTDIAPLVAPHSIESGESILKTDEKTEDKTLLISFADDSDEFNEDIIAHLDTITTLVGNDYSGKILIEAYNYDKEGGMFSRKRLSLNRAVAVRSHLLGLGYKGFSIKIINTEDASLRNNVVISY